MENATGSASQTPPRAGDYKITLRRVYEKICAVNSDEETRPALETAKFLVEGLLAGAEMAEAMRPRNVPSHQSAAFPTLRQTTLPTMTSSRPVTTYASVARSNLGPVQRPPQTEARMSSGPSYETTRMPQTAAAREKTTSARKTPKVTSDGLSPQSTIFCLPSRGRYEAPYSQLLQISGSLGKLGHQPWRPHRDPQVHAVW